MFALTSYFSWLSGLRIYFQRQVLIIFVMGFSSGLPLMLVFGVLSFWLREADVSRADIGYFSWVAMAYAIKWLWSPLADNLKIPLLHNWLGRRRSWLLTSQVLVAIAICCMALTDPQQNLALMAGLAVLLAFSSATQDINVDAFRIESAAVEMQAALAAAYLTGYRLAMILASAGTLWLAALFSDGSDYDLSGWQQAYLVMGLCMLPGILTTLLSNEPASGLQQQVATEGTLAQRFIAWLKQAVIAPFTDFFNRYKWHALLILALIACYRLTDVVMGVMANAFYVDMGYSKEEVASVSKVFGVIMTLVGAALGGILINQFGVMKVLFAGAILSAATNLLFSALSQIGYDLMWLTLVISADNLSAGIATSAFIAYLSSLVNLAFTATQYAMFSSLMLLLPKFTGGFSGQWVDQFGYSNFFIMTAAMGLPVLVLIMLLARANNLVQNKKAAE
ncbi:MFS transporter, PAT family, beta-lactamase induction signal transducer AmpG [Arsukibacterium tuosuense]|uniref:MFS transporter, PAT family, beta-lactamase induction signal transducer AmpG n=1 Tax=Arsukibacterium tuosuense TaxID=1323745 RepID=A0A285J0X7_9GAMM|nr:AmpG family muropeptide MFS transporter [Arsukibacterium tuosuense]SNY53016.1 MFS transporter, PAT family, beta-lactamase induction signal transducer AmpG [Arsukibacterium tuosuense]